MITAITNGENTNGVGFIILYIILGAAVLAASFWALYHVIRLAIRRALKEHEEERDTAPVNDRLTTPPTT